MPAVRRQILIAASPRSVWKHLTTADGLAAWLVDEARIDARKGGRVVLCTEDEEGNPVEDSGTILNWRPTSHLEITFDRAGRGSFANTRLAFQVALDGGETRVSIVHSGEPLEDPDANKQTDKEWRQALNALQGLLDKE